MAQHVPPRFLRFPLLCLVLLPLTAAAVPTAPIQFVDIPVHDGTVLKANVIAPATPGPHPAIVFVSSWTQNDLEYLAQAFPLAQRGYVVLSYTPRGWWFSGGGIDVAGPLDIADASSVIDWLIAHTDTDGSRIGFAGVSYGAGISLVASGFDPRIRAVAALSGWTDLVEALYGGETRRPQLIAMLDLAARFLGRPGAELRTNIDNYFANRNIEGLKVWARGRSATRYVDRINANAPAILLANSFQDSLCPPNPVVDFYEQLTGPKRLELAPGEHAFVEATGLVGLPNHVWTSVTRWMDQHVAGVDSGIANEAPVVLRTNTGAKETYATWGDVSSTTRRMPLGTPRLLDGTGTLGGAQPTSGSRTIWSGFDTIAGAGVPLLTNGFQTLTGIPPIVWLPGVSRFNAGVWISAFTSQPTFLRGSAVLRLRITPSRSSGTVVAYLYDAVGDFGGLVVHAPLTWKGATPGVPLDLDVRFPATAHDVPAGHRLALVVDTEDPLYLDANTTGATLALGAPSWLDLPLR